MRHLNILVQHHTVLRSQFSFIKNKYDFNMTMLALDICHFGFHRQAEPILPTHRICKLRRAPETPGGVWPEVIKTWMIIYFNVVCCHTLSTYKSVKSLMWMSYKLFLEKKKRVESLRSRGRDERFPRSRFEMGWNTDKGVASILSSQPHMSPPPHILRRAPRSLGSAL